MASSSKWAAASLVMAVVADGKLSLDETVDKTLTWWPQQDGMRAPTLREFLSMTSGWTMDGNDCPYGEQDCPEWKGYGAAGYAGWAMCTLPPPTGTGPDTDFVNCTRHMIELIGKPPLGMAPGKQFRYSGMTFQVPVAMAIIATGLSFPELAQKYLLAPLNMTDSAWVTPSPELPMLGVGLNATARDMAKFLVGHMNNKVVGNLTKEMETVNILPGMYSTSNELYGPYCLGNWLQCVGTYLDDYSLQFCLSENMHSHPGCGGVWPAISRARGYWFLFFPEVDCNADNNYCGLGPDGNDGPHDCPALDNPAKPFNDIIIDPLNYLFPKKM